MTVYAPLSCLEVLCSNENNINNINNNNYLLKHTYTVRSSLFKRCEMRITVMFNNNDNNYCTHIRTNTQIVGKLDTRIIEIMMIQVLLINITTITGHFVLLF